MWTVLEWDIEFYRFNLNPMETQGTWKQMGLWGDKETTALNRCWRRVRSWRVPPGWSFGDWTDEINAQGLAAAWQAHCEFDPTLGVPLAAFLSQRVVTRILSRYRQEWTYGQHFINASEEADVPAELAETLNNSFDGHEAVHFAMAQLSEKEKRLIQQLFWEDCKEAQIARGLGVTQQAVSKQKRIILHKLAVSIAR